MENIKRFCELLREYLLSDPAVDPERVSININDFAESAVNVLVSYHYHFADPTMELKVQQDHLMTIAKLTQELKIDFAFPTRTLIVNTAAPQPTVIRQ